MADILVQADKLQAQNDFKGQIALLEKIEDNIEALWRTARAYYQLGCESSDQAEKKTLLEKGFEIAKKVVQLNEKHYAGQKWCGIILGSLGDFSTTKDKIANAFIIKDYFLKAEEASPEDATIKHALGKWCYSVASVGWIERQAASLLFATPPSSSYEEALAYFTKCHELAIKNPIYAGVVTQNAYSTALCYEALKKIPEAKEWLQKCIDSAGTTKPDLDSAALAKQKLPTLGQGYFW